jgi:predicted ATPase
MTLGCSDRVGVDLVELLTERLADGRTLAIVDNCEHVLDGVAPLLARLLAVAPDVCLIATSRSPLDVPGEIVYRIPTMSTSNSVADAADALGYESVRLFVDRAIRQNHAFTVDDSNCESIARICVQLDGLPLAIELAAARVRSLSVPDIEKRLEDRFTLLTGGARTVPPRQRTLKALIDWSFDLLSPEERFFLCRLTVFAASFDLRGAAAVAGGETALAGDLVMQLVDKGLIQPDLSHDAGRYRMLESIRQYAAARLGSTDDSDARMSHASFFGDLLIEAAAHFAGPGQVQWRSRLIADDDNIRVAFATLLRWGEPEYLLRVAAAITRYWNSRGSYGDEMELVEAALDRPDTATPTVARAEALAAAGFMLFRRGGTARAQNRLDEAYSLARQLGASLAAADALRSMAWVADRRGESDSAAKYAAEAVEHAIASGDAYLISRAFDVRAATRHASDPGGARADYAEALSHCNSAGDALGQASTLNNLAILELEQGDASAARRCYERALAVVEEHDDSGARPFIRYGLGLSALLDGDCGTATTTFGQVLSESRHTGQKSLEAYSLLGIAAARALVTPDDTAALLLGAAGAMFDRLDERPEQTESDVWVRARDTLAASLGSQLDGLLAAGGLLSVPDITGLAAVSTSM